MEDNYFKSGYADVNGLHMYYEIHGTGKPLVLIHGGGSSIYTSFGRIIQLLAKHRQVIGVELQAHGHTNDRDSDLSFQQDADDVAALLHHLQIYKADILGFSNGGQTTIEIALRHPELINKIILASIFYKKSGTFPQFWDGMAQAKFSDMPQVYKDEYLKINNSDKALMTMFKKDVHRMQHFKGWTDEQMKSIKAPTLLINGNNDVGSVEHAVVTYHQIPNCQLAIFPGGHGDYMGEIATTNNLDEYNDFFVPIINKFLDAKETTQ